MRFALGIEYDGGAYSGWQRLSAPGTPSAVPTLQGALEQALSTVADAPVATTCATTPTPNRIRTNVPKNSAASSPVMDGTRTAADGRSKFSCRASDAIFVPLIAYSV